MTTALIIAHPGHELRVFGWLAMTNPITYVLTDGSGNTGISRLPHTTLILHKQGASIGNIYGLYTDTYFYSRILQHDLAFFVNLSEKIYHFVLQQEINCIVGDAWEGYNPTHDLCRALINTIIKKIRLNHGRIIKNYALNLNSHPKENSNNNSILLQLDQEVINAKKSVAFQYKPLREEVTAAFKRYGEDIFTIECLNEEISNKLTFNETPYYETYGEQRVQSGRYFQVIRYHSHIVPIINILNEWAELKNASTVESFNY